MGNCRLCSRCSGRLVLLLVWDMMFVCELVLLVWMCLKFLCSIVLFMIGSDVNVVGFCRLLFVILWVE